MGPARGGFGRTRKTGLPHPARQVSFCLKVVPLAEESIFGEVIFMNFLFVGIYLLKAVLQDICLGILFPESLLRDFFAASLWERPFWEALFK